MAKTLFDGLDARLDSAEIQKLIDRARSQVEYSVVDFTAEILASKLKDQESSGEGDVYVPEYQRPMVWSEANKSYFIESLLLRMPIPPLFFCDISGRLEIVDGSQRLRTIKSYFQDEFRVVELEKLDFLNGFFFSELPEVTQRRLRISPIRTFVLGEKTANSTRFDIFRRLNTSGKRLTDAELRKGAFPGPLTDAVVELSRLPLFMKLCPVGKTKTPDSERQELVLRFFAYLEKYLLFRHDVAAFLDDFLEEANAWPAHRIQELRQKFTAMLSFVSEKLPYGFRKTPRSNLTPRVRFEAISVGIALALDSGAIKAAINLDWLDSDDFKELTRTDASNSSRKLKERIEFVRDQLIQ